MVDPAAAEDGQQVLQGRRDEAPEGNRALRALAVILGYLTLGMVLLGFTNVVMRYFFNIGWISLQEAVTYLHAAVFMLGAAWTLEQNGHVRLDIFYRNRSPRGKAITNLAGYLVFVLPVSFFILLMSWDYVLQSWRILEGSREAGGIPAVFLLKSLIPAAAILLILQSFLALPGLYRQIKAESVG